MSILGIELISTFSLRTGIVTDIYSRQGVTRPIHIANQGYEWRTEVLPSGAWHKPNFNDKQTKSCFNVIYKSNNIGARDTVDYDNSFSNESIIALGDSFIEGYGLNQTDTLPYILEKTLNRKVFNLGSSYDVGPLQYYLIYKNIGHNLLDL